MNATRNCISGSTADQNNNKKKPKKRDFQFAYSPVCYQETGSGFELSGTRLPQIRPVLFFAAEQGKREGSLGVQSVEGH